MKKLFTFLKDEFYTLNTQYRIKFYTSIVILILGCSLSGFVQIIFKNMVSSLPQHNTLNIYLVSLFIFYSISWTVNQITNIIVWLLTQKCMIEFSKKIIIQTFAHIISVPYHILTKEKNRNMVMYLENIFTALQIIISNFIIHILPAMIEMIIAFCFFSYLYGIYYTILLIILIVLFFSITYYTIAQNEEIENQYYKTYDAFKDHINGVLFHIEIIKTYNAMKYECQTLYSILKSFFETSYTRNLILDKAQIYHIILCGMILCLFTLLSYFNYQKGIITIGDFVLINNYFLQFSIPMTFLGYIFSDVYKNIMILKQAYEVFSLPQDKHISYDDKTTLNYDISFNNVTLEENQYTLISNISCLIKEKNKIAIVGKSGSGKSTLLKLLSGLLHPSSGTIEIGTINLSSYKKSYLSQLITLIPQQSYLFPGSIKDNIIYNTEKYNESNLKNIIKNLGLEDKINSLKNKFDTLVQDITLSGGEKQRISIARALLRNTPIFLLDEVTASLDYENEHAILNYFDEIFIDKTVITITHRMQTMEKFDFIILIDKGKIEGICSHKDLLENNALYQSLYNQH
jgi:ATP-binding cassette subfamily B protein